MSPAWATRPHVPRRAAWTPRPAAPGNARPGGGALPPPCAAPLGGGGAGIAPSRGRRPPRRLRGAGVGSRLRGWSPEPPPCRHGGCPGATLRPRPGRLRLCRGPRLPCGDFPGLPGAGGFLRRAQFPGRSPAAGAPQSGRHRRARQPVASALPDLPVPRRGRRRERLVTARGELTQRPCPVVRGPVGLQSPNPSL